MSLISIARLMARFACASLLGAATLAGAAVSGTHVSSGSIYNDAFVGWSEAIEAGRGGIGRTHAEYLHARSYEWTNWDAGYDDFHTVARAELQALGAASLSGPLRLPRLRALAELQITGNGQCYDCDWREFWVHGVAQAAQLFTYHGPSTTLELQVDLAANPGARRYSFIAAAYEADVYRSFIAGGGIPWTQAMNLVQEHPFLMEPPPGYADATSFRSDLGPDLAPLALDLHDGEQFVIWTGLQAMVEVRSNSTVDVAAALSFSNATGLTPEVPEPASSILMPLGLVAVAVLARRRRKAA